LISNCPVFFLLCQGTSKVYVGIYGEVDKYNPGNGHVLRHIGCVTVSGLAALGQLASCLRAVVAVSMVFCDL